MNKPRIPLDRGDYVDVTLYPLSTKFDFYGLSNAEYRLFHVHAPQPIFSIIDVLREVWYA